MITTLSRIFTSARAPETAVLALGLGVATPGATDDKCGYGDCGVYICDPTRCDYECSGHGQPEVCNGLDDNCNTVVDEGLYLRCGGCDAESQTRSGGYDRVHRPACYCTTSAM